ncbi:hypothetical protein [uncultured Fibrobacter sp.]|uniref:GTP pyrophosphokinase n=1 Tax=uncultured Fibrobacter sp. TaxID=261512 RepID=UPI00259743F9|nr:hypothetical protein [uncultured Fibrobacter sp.]
MATSFETAEEEFKVFYQKNRDSNIAKLSKIKSLIEEIIHTHFPDAVVSCRLKKEDECIKKFKRKYLEKYEENGEDYIIKDKITDILGLRIVCLYENNIQEIVNVLKKEFLVIDETNKTKKLEESSDIFGYKGHHLDLSISDQRKRLAEYEFLKNERFEVQIRSIIQDAWSTLDHKIKYKKNIPNDLKRQINALAALFEIADREFTQIREKTESYENLSPTEQADDYSANKSINAFTLKTVMEDFFPKYTFTENFKIDELAEKLSNYTIDELKTAFNQYQNIVIKYKDDCDIQMNPFTELRHIIYMQDRENNKKYLFDYQRESFDHWLSNSSNDLNNQ